MLARITFSFVLITIPVLLCGATASSVSLKHAPSVGQYGQPVTLTAVVSPAAATGKVTFYRGTTVLETEPVINGTATFTSSLMPFGAHSMTAYYSGDANYAPSSSGPVKQVVNTVASLGFQAPILDGMDAEFSEIAIGDFNKDGKADLAITELDGIAIMLGNGDGTFQTPVDYGSGIFDLGYIAVGDFNGDGNADLAVTDYYTNSVSVLLGNGDGTFQAPVTVAYDAVGPTAMVVGDFNADGIPDLAIPNSTGVVTVLLGNGDGSFQTGLSYGTGTTYITAAVTGDFNGDGKADLALSFGYPASVSMLLGNGDGTFQQVGTTVLPSYPIALVVGDFNGDGKSDLGLNGLSGVGVLLGNGDGTFQTPAYYPDGNAWEYLGSVATCDFNADGIADLVSVVEISFNNYVISVMLGNSNGTFQTPVNYLSEAGPAAGSYPGSFVLGDFNGDGTVDFAEIDYSGLIVQLGSTLNVSTTTLTTTPNPSSYGQSVTLTATVTPPTSVGTVTFYNGSTILGTANVTSGTAAFPTSSLPGGLLSLSAVYGGDPVESPSTSNTVAQQVNPLPTTIVMGSTPNPSDLGQTVTLVAKVTPNVATGSVTFAHGTSILGTATLTNGRAVLYISTLTAGGHSLTAAYLGSANYSPSTSPAYNQMVEGSK